MQLSRLQCWMAVAGLLACPGTGWAGVRSVLGMMSPSHSLEPLGGRTQCGCVGVIAWRVCQRTLHPLVASQTPQRTDERAGALTGVAGEEHKFGLQVCKEEEQQEEAVG